MTNPIEMLGPRRTQSKIITDPEEIKKVDEELSRMYDEQKRQEEEKKKRGKGKPDVKKQNPSNPVQPVASANAPNINDFEYIPTAGIYFAKRRTHLGKNWNKTHQLLSQQKIVIPNVGERTLRMPTIEEFRRALAYFKNSQNSELLQLYNEITEVRNSWRGNWLDAYFEKKKDGLYLLTSNKIKSEKLETCLMENKTPGISLEQWIDRKNVTRQGIPSENIKIDDNGLWYSHPVDGRIARFYVGYLNSDIKCDRGPSPGSSNLGVFGVADLETFKENVEKLIG